MKKKPSWFKLHPTDFLADRNVERMNIAEFGLYCYLLMRGWIDGGIPASLDELSRYAMLRDISLKRLSRLWEAVSPCWQESLNSPTKLVNPRQEMERVVVKSYWDGKERAGKASAAKRQKQKDDASTSVPTHIEQVLNGRSTTKTKTQTNTQTQTGDTPSEGVNGGTTSSIDDSPFSRLEPDSSAKNGRTRTSKRNQTDPVVSGVAANIHGRHPAVRRDCGVAAIQKSLQAILRHREISKHQLQSYLARLDRNHAAWCATEQWKKDGGQYAKGLENWLAPTHERYEAETPITADASVSLYTPAEDE